jgi:hypothetical protein
MNRVTGMMVLWCGLIVTQTVCGSELQVVLPPIEWTAVNNEAEHFRHKYLPIEMDVHSFKADANLTSSQFLRNIQERVPSECSAFPNSFQKVSNSFSERLAVDCKTTKMWSQFWIYEGLQNFYLISFKSTGYSPTVAELSELDRYLGEHVSICSDSSMQICKTELVRRSRTSAFPLRTKWRSKPAAKKNFKAADLNIPRLRTYLQDPEVLFRIKDIVSLAKVQILNATIEDAEEKQDFMLKTRMFAEAKDVSRRVRDRIAQLLHSHALLKKYLEGELRYWETASRAD